MALLATAGGLAVSFIGTASSINGVISAAYGISDAVDRINSNHTFSQLILLQAKNCVFLLIIPSKKYLLDEDSLLYKQAHALMLQLQRSIEWVEKYEDYSKARKFCNASRYERKFKLHLRMIRSYRQNFMDCFVLQPFASPVINTNNTGSEISLRVTPTNNDIVAIDDSFASPLATNDTFSS